MPLASLYALQYYGKAMASAIDQVENEEAVSAKKWQRANFTDQVVVDITIRGTQLIGEAFDDQVVVNTQCYAKQFSKASFVDSIGASPDEYDIAQAVWLIALSAINRPGTAGEALAGAGSAGNPWTDSSTYAAGTKGALLKQAAEMAELAAIK